MVNGRPKWKKWSLNNFELWYFKLWIVLDQIVYACKIKGLYYQAAKIKGLANLSLVKDHQEKNYDYHMNDVTRLYYIINTTIKVEGFL